MSKRNEPKRPDAKPEVREEPPRDDPDPTWSYVNGKPSVYMGPTF